MVWSLSDLMSVCPVPTCPRFNTRHLLSHQEVILTTVLQSSLNYFYWQGGVGSAKTIAVAAFAAAFAIMIPRSKGMLFRISFELNHETLWGYFKNSILAALEQGIIQGTYKELFSVKKAGGHTVCRLRNGSEFKAVETSNWRRVLGSNYDCIVISDAMENEDFKTLFFGEGTVGGLKSRLRGQPSSFFRLPDGSFRDMRRFIVESNPPPEICDIHETFGKEPGIRYFDGEEIQYQYFESNTIQNDHNPPNYIAEVASGHSEEDLKRILGGKTVPYYGGVKVIPEFDEQWHINDFESSTELPLLVGIDPGKQHPGVIFAQIRRCEYEREHLIRLSEISNFRDKFTHQLAFYEVGPLLGIIQHLGRFYPEFFDCKSYIKERKLLLKDEDEIDIIAGGYEYLEPFFTKVRFCIDKASEKVHSSKKDKETDRSVLLKYFGIRCKYRTGLGLDQSLNRMRKGFSTLCVCQQPQFLIDRRCAMLIDGYRGGYRYAKNKDGTHKDKPLEDHKYEDVADADRYLAENFLFCSGYEGKEVEDLPKLVDRYSWMHTGYSEVNGSYEGLER